jgi:hypothetical protein
MRPVPERIVIVDPVDMDAEPIAPIGNHRGKIVTNEIL